MYIPDLEDYNITLYPSDKINNTKGGLSSPIGQVYTPVAVPLHNGCASAKEDWIGILDNNYGLGYTSGDVCFNAEGDGAGIYARAVINNLKLTEGNGQLFYVYASKSAKVNTDDTPKPVSEGSPFNSRDIKTHILEEIIAKYNSNEVRAIASL